MCLHVSGWAGVCVCGCVCVCIMCVCVCVYTRRDVMHLCVSVTWLLVCLPIVPVALFLLLMLVLPGVLVESEG